MAIPTYSELGFDSGAKTAFPTTFRTLGFDNSYQMPFPVQWNGLGFDIEDSPPFDSNHWRILDGDVQQVDLDTTDRSFFQHSSWPDGDTLWFLKGIQAESITVPVPFFEFVTKGRLYQFKVSSTQLSIPGPTATVINQNFAFDIVRIKVRVDGIDGSITVWINESKIHTGFRPNVVDSGGNRLAYGKLTTDQVAGIITFDFIREYFDSSDQYAPWANIYEAEFNPDDIRADPAWNVTAPSRFVASSGMLTISGNQAGIYYMQMDTSVYGQWDANSVGVIEMESQLAALAGLTKWGCEFRVGNKHILMFMGYDGTQDAIRLRGSTGGATTEVVTDVSGAFYVWRFVLDFLHDKFTILKDGNELITIPFYTDANVGEVLRIGSPVGGSATPGKNWDIKYVRWIRAIPIYSSYDSNVPAKEGWNEFIFPVALPDAVVNNPTRENVGRVKYLVHTPTSLDILVDPAVDMFGTDETEYLAKIDTYLNDGTREWPARVIDYGEISKSLNERIGSYSIADFQVNIENVTGYGGKLFADHTIGLINTPMTIQYGLKEDYWEDFHTLFRGVISDIQFNGFAMSVNLVDPIPRYFNRLPNQYITSASFPNVGDDVSNYVGPIIAGIVEDVNGALTAIPVDWQVEITDGSGSKPQNDKIDFKFKPFGGVLGTYVVTLASVVYTDPVLLAADIETKMNLAIGSPPADPAFDATFDVETRKLNLNVIKGGELTLQWSEGANASINAADALGFDPDQDTSGSKKVKSERVYWNKFVIARHWCKEDTNAKLWIGENYIGDKDDSQINFTFDHVTPDGLKWTIVHIPYKTVGDEDVRVNISGTTDDGTPSGNLVTDPVDFLKIVFTRYVEFPDVLLDAASFVAAKVLSTRRSYMVAGALTQDTEWSTFIEEYASNFRMDVWMKNDGTIAVGFFEVTIDDPGARHITDIVDIINGTYTYSTEFTNIINRIRYEYKRNYVDESFIESGSEEDASSIQRSKQVYDWPEGTLQLNWIRDNVTAQRIAASTLNLFSEANPIVNLEIPFSGQFTPIDLTDKINVTSAQGPFYDAVTNIRGYTNRLHRVIEVGVDLNEYKMSMRMQDMFRLSFNCFFLGDRTWDISRRDWLTANEEDKQTYGYLCDRPSGQFSNGDPGKRLC